MIDASSSASEIADRIRRAKGEIARGVTEAFRRYMKSEEHRISHSREPAEIMAHTEVRHEAYELLMDPAGWFGPAGPRD